MRPDTYQKVLLYVLLILSLSPISKSMAQYELKKESEFRIHSLYPVEIIDHYPQDGIYLGYINTFSEGMEVALISEDGEILISKNLHGEFKSLKSSPISLKSLPYLQAYNFGCF